MTPRDRHSAHLRDRDITEQATQWLLQLEENDDYECRAAFISWARQCPRHLEEFLLVTATYRALHRADLFAHMGVEETFGGGSPIVVPFRSAAGGNWDRPRELRGHCRRIADWLFQAGRRRLAAVSSVLPGVLIAAALVWLIASHFRIDRQICATTIGERVACSLTDGSVVNLNTRTRIEVSFSPRERQVRLLSGEALFKVRHDPTRPFRVQVGNSVVQAVGTKFDVYRREADAVVYVIEGRVRLATNTALKSSDTALQSSPVFLEAGERSTILLAGGEVLPQKIPAPELKRKLSWIDGVLSFQGETLAEAVTEFNRYNRRQLVIVDPTIAPLHVGGSFRDSDPGSFIAALRATLPVQILAGGPTGDDPNMVYLGRSTTVSFDTGEHGK